MRSSSRFLSCLARPALVVALLCSTPLVAADANPPLKITYQGNVVDANGTPLANVNPENHTVDFTIYNGPGSAATAIYHETQLVTIDKGSFSVLIGDGTVDSTNPLKTSLVDVFAGADASDRFLEIAVTTTSGKVTLQPRLRLVSSPYSILAKSATRVLDGNGNLIMDSANITISGTLKAASLVGNGAGITGIPNSATTATSGNTANAIVSRDGSGSVSVNVANANFLAVAVNANVGGNLGVGASLTVGSTVSAGGFFGPGTIPVGGIIMWSGNTIPSGWALCNGQNVNGQQTPNLSNRFIVSSGPGNGTGYGIGATGGQDSVTLLQGNLPPHVHHYYDIYYSENNGVNAGQWGSHSTDSDNNPLGYQYYRITEGGDGLNSTPFDNRPLFYALAFIMRVQ
jgi:Phage Tail Collar Domain